MPHWALMLHGDAVGITEAEVIPCGLSMHGWEGHPVAASRPSHSTSPTRFRPRTVPAYAGAPATRSNPLVRRSAQPTRPRRAAKRALVAHDWGMGDQLIVLLGTLGGAVLAFLLQSLTASRQRRHQIADRTRAEQVEAAAALPTALVEYRHAQIARRAKQLAKGAAGEALDNEVRAARAQAWSALYRFELLVDDEPVRNAAYELMGRIRVLKTIDDRAQLDRAGTEIHWGIQTFIELARARLAVTEYHR